jgi:hypothetical protein
VTQSNAKRPEPATGYPVPGVWGYVDSLGVRPGQVANFHVSSPGAYTFSIVRLGRSKLIDPHATPDDDRQDVDLFGEWEHKESTAQTLSAGSYVYVGGPAIPSGPLTIGLWLRLWRLPTIDKVQWAWAGLVTDLDYPDACRFGLLVDHAGRLALYAGDGGVFRHEDLHVTDRIFVSPEPSQTGPTPEKSPLPLGTWVHVAAAISTDGVRVYLDGQPVYTTDRVSSMSEPGPASRLRVGATAEQGVAADFLDGDIASPFVSGAALSDSTIGRIARDRGLTPITELVSEPLHAAWPLDEERGSTVRDASGSGRDGQIVQGATWQIGGPAFDASAAAPGYVPEDDHSRGHGLRLSSDDVADCEWDVTDTWEVPEDAPSGLYAGRVRLVGQPADESLAIVFAVGRTRPADADSVALLLSTNTWLAYGRRPTNDVRLKGLVGSFYSDHENGRPFFHVSTLAPIPGADPYGFESRRASRTAHSHLVRPERYAEAWLASEGYPYEPITDADLHADPGLLSRFRVLVIVGHSEYWSDEARDGVDQFLRQGGRLLSMSGNSLYWRTTFDPSMTVLESRKVVVGDDARWLTPADWGERWHSDDGREGGPFPFIGRPSHRVVGLDTQGMVDDGTPTSFAAFTVLEPGHFLFDTPERVPISADGTIGESNLNGPKASGYEFDVTARTFGLEDRLPEGMVLLASALGQRNIEWGGQDRNQGAEIIYWRRPNGGEVVAAGSIGFTGALTVDPGIQILMRNVMTHFGVPADHAARSGRG